MRSFLTATAAGFALLIFTATAPAQSFGSGYSGGHYNQPSHQHYQPYQPVYPSNIYTQPQYGGSFSYQTPSFGFGINVNPSYGSNLGIYSQPSYLPSYYPTRPFVPSHNHHHHHHHHGHR